MFKQDQIAKPEILAYWLKKAFKANYPKVQFVASPTAPNKWKDLSSLNTSAILNGVEVLKVFDGGCDLTI